ncbi:DUF3413 domain-containing protein [Colwellia sp. RSH04]|uniref:DUF3413 domain-containing protein n=1 Tax=Colwellia sp. RSH04 TaxID=2305464 RepID=UPI000E595A51|nr:DUF3413 domain-containing protein [Colwellia sp. RSH04]RHW77131.1 DUF3413 domain-containing protein [Colwellia sp. RSH04]
MVSFDNKSYSKKLLHLISWGHWFTFFNILAAIGFSSFYLINESIPETLLGQAYLFTTWVSHIAFLTFISFVLLLFPLTLIFPHTKFIRTSGSIIFTVGLLLLVLDAFIYNRLGYHLNASSSSQIIDLITEQINDNTTKFYLISSVLALVILAFQLVISNFAWKHLLQLQKTVFARFVVLFLVMSFFFSHLSHIWADANLDYDILQQDTMLPLSYPATAKTLLTKYGLFNLNDYLERKTSPLEFTSTIPDYPVLNTSQCKPMLGAIDNQQASTFIVLIDDELSVEQLQQLQQRSSTGSLLLENHIDTGLNADSWFNFFYSLPNIYQDGILSQEQAPMLFQALKHHKLDTTFTTISATKGDLKEANQTWYKSLFNQHNSLEGISTILFADNLNTISAGLHVFYFSSSDKGNNQDNYNFELFVDALLLAQKQKQLKDYIWISSINNKHEDTRLSTKPALLVYPSSQPAQLKEFTHLTSHMDLQPTLMKNWLNCFNTPKNYAAGHDLLTLKRDRVIANTTAKGMMVFNKDKSVFVDQNGNFQSYSRQLEAPITVNADFPLLIDGVHYIKQFGNTASSKLND